MSDTDPTETEADPAANDPITIDTDSSLSNVQQENFSQQQVRSFDLGHFLSPNDFESNFH